jgi:deoxyribose-phosphate aldolase
MTTQFSLDTLTYEQVAKTIDHSLLKPELTEAEVVAGCKLALEYHVASVCVKPADVPIAVEILKGSDVKVGTVISFPHGNSATATKVFESHLAIEQGAEELDMVINIGRLRSGNYDYVRDDIAAVVQEAHAHHAIVKVILENAYLTHDEKVRAYQIVEQAGGDYVKTSTGFAPSGSTLEDLRLMRATVSPSVHVKAAGGVRTLDALIDAMNAGATRIGATATKVILDDFKARKTGSAPQVATVAETGY